MKKKFLGGAFLFLTVAVIIGVLILTSRQSAKELLPRQGDVEKVGEVYTPYLSLNSTLYFLKHLDESIDWLLTKNSMEKARLELVFANKRLLEMEKLARNGSYEYNSLLTAKFLSSVKRASNFTKDAANNGEDMEDLIWIIQESVQDQDKIIGKISGQLPKDKQQDIVKVQQLSQNEFQSLLQSIYDF